MTGETDNASLMDVTDNADPSATDTPESWDYYDPDEDTVETPEEEGTEDEATETETEVEAEVEEDVETADEETEKQPVTATEDAVVQLADGETVTVKELAAGRMRQADYTRKTQELGNQRKALEAEAQKLQNITTAFVDHLSNMIPAEPDAQLAYTDPNKYTQQKAQYDAAVAQVQRLIELGSQPKEVTQNMTQEAHQRLLQEENTLLAGKFPETGTQEGRAKFFNEVAETANEVGFTTEELQQVTDHRLFALAHWAKKGMEADKAKTAAKAKAQKAPPATPRKPGQPAKKANGNREAMRKLSRSGSMRDAMAVDFD